jgi:hypothetical protein
MSTTRQAVHTHLLGSCDALVLSAIRDQADAGVALDAILAREQASQEHWRDKWLADLFRAKATDIGQPRSRILRCLQRPDFSSYGGDFRDQDAKADADMIQSSVLDSIFKVLPEWLGGVCQCNAPASSRKVLNILDKKVWSKVASLDDPHSSAQRGVKEAFEILQKTRVSACFISPVSRRNLTHRENVVSQKDGCIDIRDCMTSYLRVRMQDSEEISDVEWAKQVLGYVGVSTYHGVVMYGAAPGAFQALDEATSDHARFQPKSVKLMRSKLAQYLFVSRKGAASMSEGAAACRMGAG